MSNPSYSTPALDKGIDILEYLTVQNRPVSQKTIAQALERTPSEIFRMLMTLVKRGYVLKNDDERYTLTLRMFSMSRELPPLERLLSFAQPLMRELVQKSWQSCHIGIEDAGNIVIIDSAPSPGNWALSLRPGSVIGLTNTSTGRVLAAFRKADEAQKLFRRHQPAIGEPPCTEKHFMNRLKPIQDKGEEITSSDTTQGVINMAFPVFDNRHKAIAVVNCPFLHRIDSFDVPDQSEVAVFFRNFAAKLTEYYGGNSTLPENPA